MQDDHLTALDATFLELEQADQSAHMHIGAVMLFEPQPGGGAPPIEDIRADLEARLPDLPRFRQRLSEPSTGGLRWPRWEQDPGFDIDHHVVRAGLPSPAGEAELLEWASEYFSQRLDRARPLWEIGVIELGDGRWTMVSKTHHCMVDGVGSVDIGQTLLDIEREPKRKPRQRGVVERRPVATADRTPARRAQNVAAEVAGQAMQSLGAGLHALGGALRTGRRGMAAIAHPREALHRARAMTSVIVRDELIAAPRTSLNRPIGAKRSLAVVEVPIPELKLIKRRLGGTINDVVLAAAAGGLRRLLRGRGERLPRQGLRAMVPVNVRLASERLSLGNKLTSLFVHLPVRDEDALIRYFHQVDEAEELKSGTQATGSTAIIDVAALAPPVLHSLVARSLYATRLFNLTITNVPGPQIPLYAFGSRLTAVWPLVPLAAEHAVGIAVFSYDGSLFFCVNSDRDSVPDLGVLRDGIADSIAELRGLAEQHAASERLGPRRSIFTVH